MKKIIMFYGSDRAFSDIIPKVYRNLSSIASEMDDDNKKMEMVVTGFPQQEKPSEKPKKRKPKITNFVINADEYNSVQEHVLTNFINFITKLDITNMFIQNPPIHLQEQINRVFGDKNIIQSKHQEYSILTKDAIRQIYTNYDNRILGQEVVKEQLLKSLFPVMDNKQSKPVVVLFYGDSGLGKTETVQYLTEVLGGSLFRKQFSMYQNNEFANYLFGGRYNEKSFAKDLLARDSNVILLDEFDKANPLFHSAFYQLFDEGVYVDPNYKVDVRHALIFCTSNYQTLDEVKEKLGIPIYNRFDGIIKFSPLPVEAKRKIAENELVKIAQSDELPEEVKEKLVLASEKLSNAREIHRIVKDTVSLYQIQKICHIQT
ncbi:AAA family ATPase [Clostridium sp. chh4-2]|uniref:AAA family ATPase n=1 Tax=Clostridium sp. chh4-2 TaxID=2067550 RepID=UPI000CCDBFFD|nr:AAA family ATPase [Clostridium sp. chh4-2]PNV63195.1 AAA family ATPase [Clostridium sp. chh4-2]